MVIWPPHGVVQGFVIGFATVISLEQLLVAAVRCMELLARVFDYSHVLRRFGDNLGQALIYNLDFAAIVLTQVQLHLLFTVWEQFQISL